MEDAIELQPLSDELTLINPCIICLRDNIPVRNEDQNVSVCAAHNIFVHLKCVHKLMGSNWHVDCPNTYERCTSYKPRLVIGTEKVDLDYSVFSVKKNFYNGWPLALIIAMTLNVFASFSINECDLQVYQNSCYLAGVISSGIANLLIALLFFYYQPTIAVYFKYTSNYAAIKRKLRAEIFFATLTLVSGIPLLVLIGDVIQMHYVLALWLLVIAAIINPLCCASIAHMLYTIIVQVNSAELVFEPVQVVSLSE
jgi:hypothetical protein